MASPDRNPYRPYRIILILSVFMILAFILRVLPFFVTRDQAFFPVFDTDTWYNLRQIEVMVHHFPQYDWFDPFTACPAGKMIDWGPLFPVIASITCIVTGAATRDAIISAAGFVVPLLATLLVPLLFLIGKRIGGTMTGLTAAGLVAVISFPFFTMSSYGMVDHHVAEVLLTSIFFLVYLVTLGSVKDDPDLLTDRKALVRTVALSALAGLIFFLALVTSTTTLLALLVVAAFTVIVGIADFRAGKPSLYLGVLNLIFLAVAIVLLILSGVIREGGLSFSQYSPGLVLVLLAVMAGTLVMVAFSRLFSGFRQYLLGILALVAGAVALCLAVPLFQAVALNAFDLIFGSSVFTVGVQETLPWSFSSAFGAFSVGIFLVAGGLLVLAYRLTRRQDRELVFLAVWSILMLVITVRHQRFLSYFTINAALLAALCITEPFGWKDVRIPDRLRSLCLMAPVKEEEPALQKAPPPGKGGKRKQPARGVPAVPRAPPSLKTFIALLVLVIAIAFAGISMSQDFRFALGAKDREIPPDWLESLQWMSTHTPDPGVDYFGQYDSRTFSYPPTSYGVMAVWDAGHWITFLAHRIPITNPFQDNLAGAGGSAAFFLSDNETSANAIIAADRGRFVITDSGMAVDRFTNLVPWVSGSVDISPYIKWFLVPERGDPSHLDTVHKFDDGYFQTLIVRLQSFDGSLTEPATAEYLRYTIRKPTAQETASATGYSRVVTADQTVTVAQMNSSTPLLPEGPELLPAEYADLYSGSPVNPVRAVPALAHYRLVHESPGNASVIPFPESSPFVVPGMKVVKVFEFVPGARIAGEGIIEVPVVTNTGRAFTYRQASSGGEFTVPYSNTGNPYDVRTTGPYHIVNTTRTFTVSENEVLLGNSVSG